MSNLACPQCGATVGSEAQFCGVCGARLARVTRRASGLGICGAVFLIGLAVLLGGPGTCVIILALPNAGSSLAETHWVLLLGLGLITIALGLIYLAARLLRPRVGPAADEETC